MPIDHSPWTNTREPETSIRMDPKGFFQDGVKIFQLWKLIEINIMVLQKGLSNLYDQPSQGLGFSEEMVNCR